MSTKIFGSTVFNAYGHGNRRAPELLTGTFTMNAIATLTINNVNVCGNGVGTLSSISISPINTAAAIAEGSSKKLFVISQINGTSFTVRTADNVALPASNHDYYYKISI